MIDVSEVGRADYRGRKLEFPYPNVYGISLKIALRNVTRRLKLYHAKIKPVRMGHDDRGNPIPVNTLGRWIFGVPGYQGHCIFDSFAEKITIYIPQRSPPEVETLLYNAVVELVKETSRESGDTYGRIR